MPKKVSKEAREQQRQHDAWKHPIGTSVEVTKDNGEKLRTVTRSMPWMLGASSRGPGHTAVILVEGIAGGYLLERVCPIVGSEV